MSAETRDTLDLMIDFENGSLDEDNIIVLFQRLIDSGMAWKLQGFYGRTAMRLIENGVCNFPEEKK